ATQAGARDVTQKAVNYAETNIAAAFEFARQLLHARDPQEFLKLQQSFVQKQAESLGAQVREMGTTVAGAASRATSEATSEAKTKPAAHDSSTTRSHAASSHSVRSRGSRSRASKAGGSKSRSKK
ncbi:MAG: phasin family protein, partial [Hyphomicrobiales bacterium]|nr:phasin family protein [Hyphomicrobiales bacterium]